MADDTPLRGSGWPGGKTQEAQLLQCCVCQSQVVDSAWVLTCLHVCCHQCASLSSTTHRSAESDGVDKDGQEELIAVTKKSGRSIGCAKCEENAQVVMSATGAFLNVIEIANRSAAPSVSTEQNYLAPADRSCDASQLVTELQQRQQSSQRLFCLTCDAPCDEQRVDDEDACVQLEHDVRAARDPRVTKRLARLLDDAQRARQRLLDERTCLTAASDAATQLDAQLSSMQAKHNDELTKAKRHLMEIIEQAYARAIEELKTCSGAYKEKAKRAMKDTGKVCEHADYALRFSELVLASASASPSILTSIPELLKCLQKQLRPLAEKCRAAHDDLAAAIAKPESAVSLKRQRPPNVDELITCFIGQPTLSVAPASTNSSRRNSCMSIPAITYSRDALLSVRDDVVKVQYFPAALIKDVERTLPPSCLRVFSYSASNSTNQKDSESSTLDNCRITNEITEVIADGPASTSFKAAWQRHLIGSAARDLDAVSQSSSDAADFERESITSNFSYSAASHGARFKPVSDSESQLTTPIWRGRQQAVTQASGSQSLAAFQLSYKCWDVAIAEDRSAVFAAAYHDGMREFSFDGTELSSWQTEPANSWRHVDAGSYVATRGRSEIVYTVDTLNDGRVIVGLSSSSSVAVLRRAPSDSRDGQVPMSNSGDCGSAEGRWEEDGERVPLGSRPWRLASDGVDFVAVTHTSPGVKAQPGTSIDLVSLSERTVVQHYRFLFTVSSVAIADGENVFVASFPQVDAATPAGERRTQFTIVQLDFAGNWLWQKNFEDNLFDIACRPSTPLLYLALGRSRRVVAVSRHDGTEVAELLSHFHDAPVRLSLRRSSRQNTSFAVLRYDLRSVEVYSM